MRMKMSTDAYDGFSEDPKDYYFRFDPNVGGSDGPYFSITPKEFFDFEGCLLDNELGIDNLLMSHNFMGLTDSMYEYKGDPVVGRNELLKLGLVENPSLP